MKLSFSTLGCPEWSFKEIVASAKDLGYDGIEIRGVERDIYLPNAREFRADKIDETIKYVKARNLEICCLTSGAVLYKDCGKEISDYIELAGKLGTPVIRVLGDENPAASVNANDEATISMLEKYIPLAERNGVTLCLETNGIYANSARLKKIAEHFDGKLGVIWDIHHPYRFYGEAPEQTYGNIKKYIKHVHIKDSIMNNGEIRYKMLGEGDVPVKDALAMLSSDNFNGYVSLEWVKRWNSELEAPDIAFVRFIDEIKRMIK